MKNTTLITLLGLFLLLAPIGCGDSDDGDGGQGATGGTGAGGEPEDPGTGAAGMGGAPVTLAVPAACESPDDCPSGIECVMPEGGSVGYCDAEEAQASGDGEETSDPGGGAPVTLAAPAMCESPDDCPAGIECVIPAGGAVGFCNVDEAQAAGGGDEPSSDASGDQPISLGAPAPCMTDADCGEHTCSKPFDDEVGFCDIEEMRAEP